MGRLVTPAHLSYSSADLYALCGRKWRFAKVDRVEAPPSPALAFGAAFDAVVERVLRARAEGVELDPAACWATAWSRAAERVADWGSTSAEDEDAAGLAMLRDPAVVAGIRRIEPSVTDGEPMLQVKFELAVPGVPVPVVGFIDAVEVDGVPLDVKTSGRPWTQGRAASEMQPLVYLAALKQAGAPSPGGLFRHAVFTKGEDGRRSVDVILTRRTGDEVAWAMGVLREVWRGVEAGLYVPNPRSCFAYGQRCEFYERCRSER